MDNLSESLNTTLIETNLQDVTLSLAETFFDSALNDGVLKDIPIFGTITGLIKTAFSINDRLFLKKIIHFLFEIKDIEPDKRAAMIAEIEKSDKYKIRVGEKLLYIIDKCEDHVTSFYVAKLFSAFLKEKLDYQDFLRGTSIIQNIFKRDLEYFLEATTEQLERTANRDDSPLNEIEENLLKAGLCGQYIDQISVRDQDDWKMSEKYIVEGGKGYTFITDIGKLIRENLNDH